ncbi:MAG: zinc-binding dehydrogenase [Deltaproteobacteria bacterium]|nr:zinc-binding dehydrogenase [Deltaproteobacteria bacterium]
MRGLIIRAHGGVDRLTLEELPEREPQAHEVKVRVRAVGLNHLDLWVRRGVPGHHFPLPLVPGSDPAGTVAAVGAGVQGLAIGTEVVVAPGLSCGECLHCRAGREHRCADFGILGETRDGGCAEYVTVPAQNVLPKPASLSFVEAAAIGIPFLTAWHMLVDRAELAAKETVLVVAGGSGVGSAAIQIARLFDARVIATVGSEAKAKAARALGAEAVLNHSTDDVAKEVKRLTEGRGVDVVVEHVGAATWASSLRALAWHGRLVTCGSTTGDKVELSLRALFFKAQSVLGSTMGSLAEMRTVLEHAGARRLRPIIAATLPLAEVGRAHELLESRAVFGRVVLEP